MTVALFGDERDRCGRDEHTSLSAALLSGVNAYDWSSYSHQHGNALMDESALSAQSAWSNSSLV